MVERVSGQPNFATFTTRDAAADHVAALIEGALRMRLETHGEAGLLVSGGSTPGPVFERLSKAELPWGDLVHVGLVDERWVDEDDERSNARLVRSTLLQDQAAEALFSAMKTPHGTPGEAVDEVASVYRKYTELDPIVLLGMGGDGHTASWFPGAEGLSLAMDPERDQPVAAIDATGAPVAGDMPHRMTLTASLLNRAALGILLISGDEKRAVLEDRTADLPIHHAERLLGDRLKEVWAP